MIFISYLSGMFKNQPLLITEVFDLLKQPRDLSSDEFCCLISYTMSHSNVIDCRGVINAALDVGIGDSMSDIRRFIKQGSLFVGKRQIRDAKDELNHEEFFESGFENVKWTVIRNGKKSMEIVIIRYDELMYPSDPWFGEEY